MEFLLEGLEVLWAGLVALLFGIEAEAAALVDIPFGGNAIAKCDGSAEGDARLGYFVDFDAYASGCIGGKVTWRFGVACFLDDFGFRIRLLEFEIEIVDKKARFHESDDSAKFVGNEALNIGD